MVIELRSSYHSLISEEVIEIKKLFNTKLLIETFNAFEKDINAWEFIGFANI